MTDERETHDDDDDSMTAAAELMAIVLSQLGNGSAGTVIICVLPTDVTQPSNTYGIETGRRSKPLNDEDIETAVQSVRNVLNQARHGVEAAAATRDADDMLAAAVAKSKMH